GDAFRAQCVDPHGACDVLDCLLAPIFERVGQPIADQVAHGPRNADTAGLGERLQARCDIDAVAQDVVVLDDNVPQVDANAKPDTPLIGYVRLAVEHPTLHLDGAADRVDDAREFHEHAVAGILDDAPVIFLDLRIDQLPEMRLEAVVRAFLVC